MKFKRLISILVTVMLVIGSVAVVNAASFPDIEDRHSWANEAIESMVTRGILKGYTDGTFKPDRAVSHLETLIIASRIMGVDEDENKAYREAALKQYSGTLEAYNLDYKAEIAYLLYCGVLSASELPTYISDDAKNSALKRYEAAIVLTKLMGGEEEALANTDTALGFADSASISGSAKPYVKYVFDKGLMNGDDNNKFSPNGELTRAMISTVMYRAEKSMAKSVVEGLIESKTNEELTLTVKNNTKKIKLPENVSVKLDGKNVSLDSLSVGQQIRVHYYSGELRYIDALTANLYQTVTGTISAVSESSGVKKITFKNASGTQTYPINSSTCEYLINNKVSTYSEIVNDMYAVFTIQGGKITKIAVETGKKTVKGTLKKVVIDETTVAITVADSDGDTSDYVLSDEVSVIRNSSKTDVNSLSSGDAITITISRGYVEAITATSASRSISGTISQILIASKPTITIKTSTDEAVYTVTADTKFTVDGKADCTIYDLRLGAQADIRIDSTNLLSVSTQSAVATPTITGKITYVHPTSYVMGLSVYDPATGETKDIQMVAKSSTKITDTTSSKVSAFKSLQVGMTVVAVGSSNYGVYEVDQIIVTAVAE